MALLPEVEGMGSSSSLLFGMLAAGWTALGLRLESAIAIKSMSVPWLMR